MLVDMEYDDPRALLATNLRALMAYANEHEDSGPTTGAALEAATERQHPGAGVSDSAISRYLKKEASAHIDHLFKIAQAYDLQIWQLLYPSLEPANPPVLRRTPTETELYQLLEAGRKLLAREGGLSEADYEQSLDRDGSVNRSLPSKKPSKPKA